MDLFDKRRKTIDYIVLSGYVHGSSGKRSGIMGLVMSTSSFRQHWGNT